MDVAHWALIVSGASMAASVGSLTWNMTSFRRSGPLVQVEAKMNLESRPWPRDADGIQDWQVVEVFGQRQLNCIVVNLKVINKGRLAIHVFKVEVKLDVPESPNFSFYAPELNNDGDCRLDALSTKEYAFDLSSWYRALEPNSGFVVSNRIEAIVHLGNGRIVRAPDIPLEEFIKKHQGAVALKEDVERRASANRDERS